MNHHQDVLMDDCAPSPALGRLGQPLVASSLTGPHLVVTAEQLERRRWAEKMQALGQLAGRVAHEVNNQITLIVGRTAMLLQRPDAPSLLRDELGDILITAHRAGVLLREWLALGRKDPPTRAPLDLNDVVAAILPILKLSLDLDVKLIADCRASPSTIIADRGEVEQVLLNLVFNARDALDSHGQVAISTDTVRVDHSISAYHRPIHPGMYVVLSVTDTGTGMDEATLARIFDPYFTTKDPGCGTGMGLSTVWEIIQGYGAGVVVETKLGQGTTFKLYIPLAPEHQEPAQVAPRPSSERRETILVLGEDDLVRSLLRELLSREGYNVVDLPRGRGVATLLSQPGAAVQLVVLDTRSPTIRYEEVRRLRQIWPDVRVLQLSGSLLLDTANAEVCEPGTGLLPKPFSREALVGKVRELLDSPEIG
jgi:nitrogen-specific signal transduction histidine kinase/CheY-like chemotaxis protein